MITLVCSLLIATTAAPPTKPADVVVVCPATFEAALKPWLEYRRAQGGADRMGQGDHAQRDRGVRLAPAGQAGTGRGGAALDPRFRLPA